MTIHFSTGQTHVIKDLKIKKFLSLTGGFSIRNICRYIILQIHKLACGQPTDG